MPPRALLSDEQPVHRVVASDGNRHPPGSILATDDRKLIQDWAALHDAHPATGEATRSGPATIDVHDHDAGIRFNFPAAAPFRPISWEEWFDNFRRHDLVFVYECGVPGQALSSRYRLVPREKLRQRHPVV
jgi:hypothetical protein